MPRPAREIGGTTAATPAERRRSCSVAGLVAPTLQAVWPLTKPILTRCQCCGCMDCGSGTAAMRCDFKSQQLRALSNWNATNLWLALARLAGCDALCEWKLVAAAVGFDFVGCAAVGCAAVGCAAVGCAAIERGHQDLVSAPLSGCSPDVARVAPYGRDTRQERGHRPAGHRHLRGATLAARGVARGAWESRPRTRTCMESSVWSD